MQNMSKLYKTLGLTKDASAADIKSAYRKLAKKYHPDLHPGNEENEKKFKDISLAYNILSHEDKRAKYDQGAIDDQGNETGFHGSAGGGFNFREGQSPFGGFGSSDMFSHIFDDILGGNKASSRKAHAPQKTHAKLSITFLEAAKGCTRSISCPSGKQVELKIPAGIKSGQSLRVKNQGTFDPVIQKNGDLYVEITVMPDSKFTVKGDDIYSEEVINISQAVKGDHIRIETIDGPISLKISPYTNTGDTLRLKEKGLVSPTNKKRGHHYVKIKLKLHDPKDSDLEKFIDQQQKKSKTV